MASSPVVRLLRPLAQSVRLMVARAIVNLVDDGRQLQSLQVGLLADEVRDNAERFQQYGFTSHPLPGAEAVAVCAGGVRDHVLVIAVDDRRYRLRALQPGEVALYSDEGDKLVIKRGGTIEVTASTQIVLNTPLVRATGNLQVDGSIHSDGNVVADGNVADASGAKTMAGMRAVYNSHHHGASPAPDSAM